VRPDAPDPARHGEAGLSLFARRVWDGKRIIPSAWVERARNGKVTTSFGKYANLWWAAPDRDAFMGLGRHGQCIVVFPTFDVVAVMTGVVPDGEKGYPVPTLIDQISNAVKSDKPLPPDPDGEAAPWARHCAKLR
jgi:CubicO group peptidase (beta-lactamase class C family)